MARLTIFAISLAAAVAGCATAETGRAFNASAAESFAEGTTTRQQVEAALGKAASVTIGPNGVATLMYSHYIGKGNGFTGKTTAMGNTAIFTFNSDGVLIAKTISATGSK